MARSSAIQSRKESDAYATRAVLVELLKALRAGNPALMAQVSAGIESGGMLRPDDVPVVPTPLVLEAARMILDEVK